MVSCVDSGLDSRVELEFLAGPDAGEVIAAAAQRREPVAVVRDDSLLLAARVVESDEADSDLATARKLLELALEIVEIPDGLTVDFGYQTRTRDRGRAEHVARIRDVDAGGRPIEVPRLLIRQVVKDTVAILDVLVRREIVQILDIHRELETLAAALDRDRNFGFDVGVEQSRKRHEFGDELAFDADQDVAGLQGQRRRRTRQDLRNDENPGLVREGLADVSFGFAGQSEPASFGKRLVHELRLQRAARHVAASLHFRERIADPVERQEETRCRLVVAAGVQCQHAALDIDDRRTRRTARSPRRGLHVEGVEIVVPAAPVVRRLPVETGDRAGQDGKPLACIVADHAISRPISAASGTSFSSTGFMNCRSSGE